jgi:hypothetical protein
MAFTSVLELNKLCKKLDRKLGMTADLRYELTTDWNNNTATL